MFASGIFFPLENILPAETFPPIEHEVSKKIKNDKK
jgi:hypothetical protein